MSSSPSSGLRCALVLALSVCLSTFAVRADGGPASNQAPTPASGYEEAVRLGFKEFELGNYPEARSRFLEAHRLQANARTLRALGMVEYELRNYGEAIARLEDSLASDVKPLEGQTRKESEALLAQARGYVARIDLDVNPGNASLVVDGVPLEVPPGRALLLQIGEHNLEFRAPGRIAEKRRLSVRGGEQEHLKVLLLPAEQAMREQDGAKRKLLVRNPWLWTALGVVVAGAATGMAIALAPERTQTRMQEPYGGSTDSVISVR